MKKQKTDVSSYTKVNPQKVNKGLLFVKAFHKLVQGNKENIKELDLLKKLRCVKDRKKRYQMLDTLNLKPNHRRYALSSENENYFQNTFDITIRELILDRINQRSKHRRFLVCPKSEKCYDMINGNPEKIASLIFYNKKKLATLDEDTRSSYFTNLKDFLIGISNIELKIIVRDMNLKRTINETKDLVQYIINVIHGIPTVFDKRRIERNMDLDMKNYGVDFDSTWIPFDVMNIIFSYLELNTRTLNGIGLVNEAFYILLLTRAIEINITNSNMYKIPTLVLNYTRRVKLKHTNELKKFELRDLFLSLKNVKVLQLQKNLYNAINVINKYNICFPKLECICFPNICYLTRRLGDKFELLENSSLFPKLTKISGCRLVLSLVCDLSILKKITYVEIVINCTKEQPKITSVLSRKIPNLKTLIYHIHNHSILIEEYFQKLVLVDFTNLQSFCCFGLRIDSEEYIPLLPKTIKVIGTTIGSDNVKKVLTTFQKNFPNLKKLIVLIYATKIVSLNQDELLKSFSNQKKKEKKNRQEVEFITILEKKESVYSIEILREHIESESKPSLPLFVQKEAIDLGLSKFKESVKKYCT